VLTGGAAAELPGSLASGFYIQAMVFHGSDSMRVFEAKIFGRENHKMMLGHYQQTKNQLMSDSESPMGFF